MGATLLILGWCAAMSAVTFVVYALDKAQAGRGRRVPERTLHTLAAMGGWPGALAGVFVLRHKSRKTPFLLVLWAIVAVHASAWAWWFLG